ncbi:TRAP transporter substrate-binding protein [Siccirubricoccus sp. KC 17139]|uniref:TRAP transporter substrate-binding protein n=1 Tax=Siccirubricoccus soli TaxID=2899147 RepID=A0ABT1D1Z5_9PROT|nr:TRAP transporter substrate-binding protein [Siccirubricoccus soli]MCO6415917.1 TRAP transporter substrate-binding protein [Siccirubricoccus soli]MCP2682049.1 TRAP transporter substrate-binding protein [Siccirubricoccus soli]
MPTRRLALLAAPALLLGRGAAAQEVTLRLHHFLPAVSNVHRFFLQPWAQKVAKESDNRLRIQIFPAMQLGGAPPQLFDQARDGVADIIWTLPGNTPGRFPRIEVFELPFVSHKRAIVNCLAIQEFAQSQLREEFREVHPLCVWGHGEGLIHAKREVRSMEDLRGLKLRFPSRLNGEALRALGAAPVGMPVPQVPEALSQGVIDGAVVPWEVVPSIRLQEMVKYHTEIPGSPTLYIATFILAMNRTKYEGLAPELRAVLDANSGAAAARMAAVPWDERNPVVEAEARRRGNQVIVITEAEKARWMEATKPVVENWLAQSRERGLDGAALLEQARALVAKHGAGIG